MSTAREILTLAFKEATVLGVGQTLLAEDVNDGLTYLKNMLSQWQKRRWLVPALTDLSLELSGQKKYTIGPGGDFDVQRPADIKAAYVVQLNTGQTPVSLGLSWISSFEDYARITVKDLNSLPDHFFYDGAWPKGNIYFWPIGSSQYEAHILVQRQLAFVGLGEGEITDGGTLYVNGVYENVNLTGGSGVDAQATITVAGGIVTAVNITDQGQDYVVGNVLSASADDLGGAGSGFEYTITSLNANADYEFELPEEYMEAIHYNLAVRLISGYGVQNPSPLTGVLAKVSLNTIRKANTQVPTLVMPAGLRKRGGFNLYNPDGYGRY